MVLFGKDFPGINFKRTLAEVEGLGIPAGAKRDLLRDNALRLYKLPGR